MQSSLKTVMVHFVLELYYDAWSCMCLVSLIFNLLA